MPFLALAPAPARQARGNWDRESLTLHTLRADSENPSRSRRPHRADAPAAETAERAGRSGGGPNRSLGSPEGAEVLPDPPAYTPRRAAPSRRPGFSAKGRRSGASPPHQQVVRRWPSGLRDWGRGSRRPPWPAGQQAGLPGAGAGTARRCRALGSWSAPRRSAPRLLGRHRRHPSPQAARCRARAPRSSAPDPLPPGAGAFVPLTNPLHHAGRGEGKPARPAPASSWGLRSQAQVSMTLKVGTVLGGGRGE